MTTHYGRLIDHVHIVVMDLKKSRTFYQAVLKAIGKDFTYISEEAVESDELFISQDQSGKTCSKIHLAFQVRDREAVNKFYDAALRSGGVSNGSPGERKYHSGYYSAFIFDPDGNNIEAVFHGPVKRSTDSVKVDRLS